MFIKLIYKGQTKKLVFSADLFRFEVLEQKVIKLFNLHGQRLIFYYIDNDRESIAIMEDKDIHIMTESFPEKRDFYDIHIQISENVLYDFRNVEILKRSYLTQLKRRYVDSEEPDVRELPNDLREIKQHLELKRLESHFIANVLEYLDTNVRLMIMEQFMSRELENFDKNFEAKVLNIVNQITDISLSSINCSQHTESSFMTKSNRLLSFTASRELSPHSQNRSQDTKGQPNRSFVQDTRKQMRGKSIARSSIDRSDAEHNEQLPRPEVVKSTQNELVTLSASLTGRQTSRFQPTAKVEGPSSKPKKDTSKTIFNKFTIFCLDLKDKLFENPIKARL